MYSYKYPMPALATDLVMTYNSNLLVIRRSFDSDVYPGELALPGGFMNIDETIEKCACRELQEETGIELCELDLTLIGVYSSVNRDPRQRTVSAAYYHKFPVRPKVEPGDDACECFWVSLFDVVDHRIKLAFDHNKIVYDYYMNTLS